MEDEKFNIVKDGTIDSIKEEVKEFIQKDETKTIKSKFKSILTGIKNAILPIKERDVIFFLAGAFIYAFLNDII